MRKRAGKVVAEEEATRAVPFFACQSSDEEDASGGARSVTGGSTSEGVSPESADTKVNMAPSSKNSNEAVSSTKTEAFFPEAGASSAGRGARRRKRLFSADAIPSVIERAKRETRRVVTGHEGTRVRDFVKIPRVVRKMDKYSFTLGVLGISTTEYVMLSYPELFGYYYCAVMAPLLSLRIYLYHQYKWHYFLIDFCYFVNLLGFLLALTPLCHYPEAWQTLFIASTGPVMLAIVAWRNSLVFHSLDKVTSVYIHLLPALFSWCERWHGHPAARASLGSFTGLWLVWPTCYYLLWQALYLVQTEVIDRKRLDADATIQTSFRWLVFDSTSGPHAASRFLCRKLGILGAHEEFAPASFKAKVVFVGIQLVYTEALFVVGYMQHAYKVLNTLALMLIFATAVWNGANYYIDVFSKSHDKVYKESVPAPAEKITPEPTVPL